MANKNPQVIVTGASSGIGRATAIELAKQGYDVHLIGRNQERLARVQQETTFGDVVSYPYQLELTDKAAVKKTFDQIIKQFGPIAGLVNSAGIFSVTDVTNYDDPTWSKIMNVNFFGTLYPTLALLPQLYAQGFGSVVNITSVDAFDGIQDYSAYSASKGAVTSLTKTLAIESAKHNVRVNAIVPGVTDTEMTHDRIQENLAKYQAKVPLGRAAQANEVAKPIVFLVSDGATYITGQNVHVNGGWRLA
ncbi:SDR family NAD(P)-dependent oxidoreductase [Lentilactobacillus hilgardii]|uniref:SDR family NAD(P)-dependent oxidoreductase n=1 Tax=Lentilactobacillus hilgardii TaxID=1588 RepID=UPI0021C3FF44|nr:SDR family oxidoreductase [Lentilactobacillus hilgardii]MCP9334180.1 SDR family oxidoreductase [Lentilactobacillus hilgardii]MCP9350479.1 SDR family oxidoreductase [Lentilactobacillus hilgardii]MCP9353682.1 SDR family oxidoreductase [Lentilactobacillus hilgardii]